MSARLLKKVLQEQEATEQDHQQLVHSEDESESPVSSAPARNPFDLLIDDDENDDRQNLSDGDELGTAEESGYGNVDGLQSNEKASSKPIPSMNSKSKKKKKKKTKEKLPSNPKDQGNSLDALLENLSIGEVSSKREHAASSSEISQSLNANKGTLVKKSKSSILQVDPKFLIAENELRRIFGSKVVNSFERGQQSGNSRHSLAGRRGGSHSHRKSILVSPSEHWPRWDGSLSMELLESSKGVNYFRYVHSPSYSQAQRAFEAAKAIHDLNGVIGILIHHPYHVDSLITLAEYFKFSGEHQRAADVTAKCLYALECAWHPLLTPLQGNCQLKHNHDTNKPLFTTLFTHMKNMDRRGCHRSALEICKLLLSLDSDDPVGALFCIDYYALRAEEHLWLEKFSEEYGSDNSLWLFPNFSYSLAICRYYLDQKEGTDVETRSGKASPDDLMKQALMLHPSVLKKLVAKVPLKDQVWTRILENSYFRSEKSGSPSLDHLINLYVERSYLIWRLPEVQKLLRDSAHAVIATLKDNRSDAKDWTCIRKEAFSSEKNEYSHLLLSDFSDAAPTLPPEELQNFMVDPRMRDVQNDGAQVMAQPGQARAPRGLTNRNALAVLLESILPWIDYGEADVEHAPNDNNDQAQRD